MCVKFSGFCDGKRKFCKHDIVSDVSFVFHRITLDPIREVILHDYSVFVSTSRLVFHVQNFVIWRDQVSELCRRCNLIQALLWFYSTHGSYGFCLLTDFTIGILQLMNEQIVVSAWW